MLNLNLLGPPIADWSPVYGGVFALLVLASTALCCPNHVSAPAVLLELSPTRAELSSTMPKLTGHKHRD